MSEKDPLLRQADALMQRHRGSAAAADDLPVLTDIVADGRVGPGEPPAPAPGPAAGEDERINARVEERLARLLPMLRRQVAAELDAWFEEQLPQIVMSLLDGFSERLVAQISARARGDVMTWLQTAGEDLLGGSHQG